MYLKHLNHEEAAEQLTRETGQLPEGTIKR